MYTALNLRDWGLEDVIAPFSGIGHTEEARPPLNRKFPQRLLCFFFYELPRSRNDLSKYLIISPVLPATLSVINLRN